MPDGFKIKDAKRVGVWLPPREIAALDRVAEQTGRSRESVIRHAIRTLLDLRGETR